MIMHLKKPLFLCHRDCKIAYLEVVPLLGGSSNLSSFRQAKILLTAKSATFFVHRLTLQCRSWQKDQDHRLAPPRLATVVVPANLLQSHPHPAVPVSEHELGTFEPRAVAAFKDFDDANAITWRIRRCPFGRPRLLDKLLQGHASRRMHDCEIERKPLPLPRLPVALDNVKGAVVFWEDV